MRKKRELLRYVQRKEEEMIATPPRKGGKEELFTSYFDSPHISSITSEGSGLQFKTDIELDMQNGQPTVICSSSGYLALNKELDRTSSNSVILRFMVDFPNINTTSYIKVSIEKEKGEGLA